MDLAASSALPLSGGLSLWQCVRSCVWFTLGGRGEQMETLFFVGAIAVAAFAIGKTVAEDKQQTRDIAVKNIKFDYAPSWCKDIDRMDLLDKIRGLDDSYVLRVLEEVTRRVGHDDRAMAAKVLVDRELGLAEEAIWAEIKRLRPHSRL